MATKTKPVQTLDNAEMTARKHKLMTTALVHRAVCRGVEAAAYEADPMGSITGKHNDDGKMSMETTRSRLATLVKNGDIKVRGYFTPTSGKGSAFGKVKLWGVEAIEAVRNHNGGGTGGTLEILGE